MREPKRRFLSLVLLFLQFSFQLNVFITYFEKEIIKIDHFYMVLR